MFSKKLQDKEIIKQHGFTHYYYLYAVTIISFIQNDEQIRNIAFLYFIVDLLLQFYMKGITNFILVHHSIMIIIIIPSFTNISLLYFVSIIKKQEISSIIYVSYILKIIPEYIFNILFPLTFIYFRIIDFNYNIFIKQHHNYIYFLSIIMNGINLYNIYKMLKKIINKINTITSK